MTHYLVVITGLLIVLMNMVLVSCEDYLSEANVIAIFCLVMVVALLLTSIIALARQPQSPGRLSFKVRLSSLKFVVNFVLILSS